MAEIKGDHNGRHFCKAQTAATHRLSPRCLPPLEHRTDGYSVYGIERGEPAARLSGVEFQNHATCKSASKTLPRVSGLNSIAMMRLMHPTVVPISIGIANPTSQLVA